MSQTYWAVEGPSQNRRVGNPSEAPDTNLYVSQPDTVTVTDRAPVLCRNRRVVGRGSVGSILAGGVTPFWGADDAPCMEIMVRVPPTLWSPTAPVMHTGSLEDS